MKIQAKKVYTISWDGDEAGYVSVGERLAAANPDFDLGSGSNQLDSPDAGDATGAITSWLDWVWRTNHRAEAQVLIHEGNVLTVDAEWELFEYDGSWT